MTIFDAIKYPIDDVPTVKQLDALPSDLFNEWKSGWVWISNATTTADVAKWFLNMDMLHVAIHHEVNNLRQMIKEYDNI